MWLKVSKLLWAAKRINTFLEHNKPLLSCNTNANINNDSFGNIWMPKRFSETRWTSCHRNVLPFSLKTPLFQKAKAQLYMNICAISPIYRASAWNYIQIWSRNTISCWNSTFVRDARTTKHIATLKYTCLYCIRAKEFKHDYCHLNYLVTGCCLDKVT